MFIGHFAVGFAAKKIAPHTNLTWLLAAPLLLDILWPVFVLLGWEHVRIEPGNTVFTPLAFDSYPWSHSLAMSALWATLASGIYFAIRRYIPGAVMIWLGVLSHWVLDFITHRPDMPLYPGSPLFGLGLWNHKAATMVIEVIMLALGVWIYMRATRAEDRIGKFGFYAFVSLLLLLYVGNAFGPPPPSVRVLTWMSIALWLFFPFVHWFDRHRLASGATPA